MSDKSALGKRIKEFYEFRTKTYLQRRTPTLIRLDGKAFHTYTRGLDKPFDEGLIEDMQLTTAYLCANIQGAKCGYTQSDEITILITDYDTFETSAWFDYNVQKMTSVAASLATAKFNQLRYMRLCGDMDGDLREPMLEKEDLIHTTLALFDARVFQVPTPEEAANVFVWRQRDAEKNSVAMLAQSLYSASELHKKNGSAMQEMAWQKGHNWNDLHFSKKRGSLIEKVIYVDGVKTVEKIDFSDIPKNERPTIRQKWEVVDTPIFSQNPDVLLKHLIFK